MYSQLNRNWTYCDALKGRCPCPAINKACKSRYTNTETCTTALNIHERIVIYIPKKLEQCGFIFYKGAVITCNFE